jgi:hypothetical protein
LRAFCRRAGIAFSGFSGAMGKMVQDSGIYHFQQLVVIQAHHYYLPCLQIPNTSNLLDDYFSA